LLLEIDKHSLLDAIKSQDLSRVDITRLGYTKERLAEAALDAVRNGFAGIQLREVNIKDNVALCVHSTPHLVVLRCLNRVIRQTIGIQLSDRDTIVRRLITILTEGVPHRAYKFDVKRFFESVDVLSLFGRLANEARIPRSATLVLENFLYELKERNVLGLPRGIQLSATLRTHLMRESSPFAS